MISKITTAFPRIPDKEVDLFGMYCAVPSHRQQTSFVRLSQADRQVLEQSPKKNDRRNQRMSAISVSESVMVPQR